MPPIRRLRVNPTSHQIPMRNGGGAPAGCWFFLPRKHFFIVIYQSGYFDLTTRRIGKKPDCVASSTLSGEQAITNEAFSFKDYHKQDIYIIYPLFPLFLFS